MRSISFHVSAHVPGWSDEEPAVPVLEFEVDGVPFRELVRRAELPDALAEQRERADEFAPEAAPLLAGAYAYSAAPFERFLGALAGGRGRCRATEPQGVAGPWC